MAKKVNTFGPKTTKTLYQMAKDYVAGSMPAARVTKPPGNQAGIWLMKSTSVITAADYHCTGSPSQEPRPGSGTAVIAYRDPTTGLMAVAGPTPKGTTVYSILNEAVPIGRYFFGKRDLAGTIWVESILPACDGGSGGSGPGSGSGCIDVVTDVRFDVYTCQLIVCTRNICFPPGTIIGPEDCGGSGSGG